MDAITPLNAVTHLRAAPFRSNKTFKFSQFSHFIKPSCKSGTNFSLKCSATNVSNNIAASTNKNSLFKNLIEDIKPLGKIRVIVNTGVGILESVTGLEDLDYQDVEGRGEFAGVLNAKENVDFHLNVDKVKSAKIVKGNHKGKETFVIRFLDEKDGSAATFLVAKNADQYDAAQAQAFQRLMDKYGSDVSFV